MITVQKIEKAVAILPKDKLSDFRGWFDQFDANEWDRQFEENVKEAK